ncbi:unnamed protein product [Polarella glacialis]|uniref:Ribosomal protein L15 n=1 Tax=Polarella glacialis TaxID=89957 RepID=A0A813K859_POLGL|nr:unnamed protein product [Polarella glacialis]
MFSSASNSHSSTSSRSLVPYMFLLFLRYWCRQYSAVWPWRAVRKLRNIAEERVGRKCGGLRVLNSYWVAQDAVHKWFEVVMVDPLHKCIRDDPRIIWICKNVMKHRELRGLTAAGRKARALLKKGKRATKLQPSYRAAYRKHSLMRLRRFR